ncbi:MAG: hypothetical protein ABH950_05495 [Candidatus Altiarchaeota archaeon]
METKPVDGGSMKIAVKPTRTIRVIRKNGGIQKAEEAAKGELSVAWDIRTKAGVLWETPLGYYIDAHGRAFTLFIFEKGETPGFEELREPMKQMDMSIRRAGIILGYDFARTDHFLVTRNGISGRDKFRGLDSELHYRPDDAKAKVIEKKR